MRTTRTVTLSTVNSNSISLIYNLATDGQNYYLIDCCQSPLGNSCFIFYWLLPINVIEITKKDFENLSQDKTFDSPKRRGGFKAAFETVLGLIIGNTLYPFIGNVHLTGIPLGLLSGLALVIVTVSKAIYNRRVRRSVQDELQTARQTQIYLKPVTLSVAALIIYLILFALAVFFTWLYWSTGGFVTWLFLLPIFLLYSLQSKLAFLPGEYKITTR